MSTNNLTSEIQQLQKDMKNQLSNATKGVLPDAKTEIPEFLTPEKTLKIYEKIMKTSALKIRECFQNLKQEGNFLIIQKKDKTFYLI